MNQIKWLGTFLFKLEQVLNKSLYDYLLDPQNIKLISKPEDSVPRTTGMGIASEKIWKEPRNAFKKEKLENGMESGLVFRHSPFHQN